MSVATKQELEAVIAAMYNDLCVNIDKAWELDDNDDVRNGFHKGLIAARDLLGIAVKTYRITIPDIETEEPK